MTFGKIPSGAYMVRRAHCIEDLPDDLAAALEAGLDDLWNPETSAKVGDNVISSEVRLSAQAL